MEQFTLKKPIKHIAFIMDGNGRWAKKRLMPRTYGHKVACKRIIEIVRFVRSIGIKVVTLYAFSTENWNRPEDEITKLFQYLDDFFNEYINEFIKEKCRIQVSGDISRLPEKTQKIINEAIDLTKDFDDYVFNICLNYGGRQEIVRATKLILKDVKSGKLDIEKLDTEIYKDYLYTKGLPEIDLMVRTSGEKRISNFLPYQLAYSEFIFTDTCWPDFTPDKLKECLKEYEKRDRRFGAIKE